MEQLPQELGASIAVFLEADDLASVTRTNHAVRSVFNDSRTWRMLYRRDTTPEVCCPLSFTCPCIWLICLFVVF